MSRNNPPSFISNMPLLYSHNNNENYPQITSMLRKTKRDESRLAGSASKRPALASLTNIQSSGPDLAKQIKQRQENPFSVRVDTKKPSPKQKQLASRPQRTTCTNPRIAASVRQSTLPSFSSTATASSSGFTVFRDTTSNSSFTGLSSKLKSAAECPMSVEKKVSVPLAPRQYLLEKSTLVSRTRQSSGASSRFNLSTMEIDEPSNQSDMSIDLTDEVKPFVKNIDKGAGVLDCPEYVLEIDSYLRKCEEEYKPRANYMTKQRHISFSHRSTVVDWMYEVCDEFHMNQKTFQLAVSYVDRFMSKMSMPRRNLQLLGTTALFVAFKVEETEMPPGLAAKFVWITENTYTTNELFRMENLLLSKLDFEINSTTTSSFKDRFLKASEGDCRETYFTEYLCDRAAVKGEHFLNYTPSLLTAAAVGLAKATFRPGIPVWTPTLSHYTKYNYEDLSECMAHLLDLYRADFSDESRQFPAVWNKYNLPRYMLILLSSPILTIPIQ